MVKKGQKGEIPTEKNYQKRFNLFAAINGMGEVVYHIADNKQSKVQVKIFLDHIHKFNHKKPCVVTLDNLNTHRNKQVYKFAEDRCITLHFQPSFSPFLNGVEELWRQLRLWLGYRLFRTKAKLKTEIQKFFRKFQFVNINIVSYLC